MMLKQPSLKLPLLIALPIVLAAGITAVLLIPNDPPPVPQPPAPLLPGNDAPPSNSAAPLPDPDPLPRPEPKPGAPSDHAVARAMEAEIHKAFELIRARLEQKYKYAEYQLDRAWTLETLLRKRDNLEGVHFTAADYALTYPEDPDAIALIACNSIKGTPLPDGPIVLRLNVRTGESRTEGRIYARNAQGYVLLNEEEYEELSREIRWLAQSHMVAQAAVETGLAECPKVRLYSRDSFDVTDFVMTPLKGNDVGAEFACRTIKGRQVAEPAVITMNYTTRKVTISQVRTAGWMKMPADRERFKEELGWWLMRNTAMQVRLEVAAGKKPGEIRLETSENARYNWPHADITPFDITIVEATSDRVVLEVSSCFGRPLPFAKVRYVAAGESFAFEE